MRRMPFRCRVLLSVVALVLSAACPFGADADEFRGTAFDTAARESTVLFLNRPADRVAEILQAQAGDSDLSIVVDSDKNVLILRGQPEAVEAATDLVRVIDQSPRRIHINVTIAVEGEGGDDARGQRVLDELQITTLDDNPAHLQFGQQVAVPSGASMSAPGRMVRNYTQQQVGTLVQVQPRIVPDGILLSLEVEKSWMESTPSVAADADLVAKQTTYTTTLQSTLSLKEGEPQSVRAKVSGDTDSIRDVVMTVTATTGDQPPREARSSGFGRPGEMRPPSGRGGFGSGFGSRASGGFGGFGGSRGRGPDSDRPQNSDASADRSLRRLFDQIDENGDELLSIAEWEATPFNSDPFRSRGFEFSEGMSYEAFENQFKRVLSNSRVSDEDRGVRRPRSDRPEGPQNDVREGQSDPGPPESTQSRRREPSGIQ